MSANEFRIAGLTSLPDRLRACWKRLDPTDPEIDPVAMTQASALLAEAAVAIDAAEQPVGAFKRGDVVMIRPGRELLQDEYLRLAEWSARIKSEHGIEIVVLPFGMDVVGPKRTNPDALASPTADELRGALQDALGWLEVAARMAPITASEQKAIRSTYNRLRDRFGEARTLGEQGK